VTDPVANALSSLLQNDEAALSLFKNEAARALVRFPSVAPESDTLVADALQRTKNAAAEFRSIEVTARRNALRAAHERVSAREIVKLQNLGDAAPADRLLFTRLHLLPPNARTFAIRTFIKREEFAEVIQQLNLTGNVLSAEITSIRKLVDASAAMPVAADVPAYVRVPFLVTGHLPPDEALRVREYLGQSAVCRAAYRDLDLLERKVARLGAAAGDPHPDAEELVKLADGEFIISERQDRIAEHVRLCAGCEAVLKELKSTAVRSSASTLLQKFGGAAARPKLAIAAIVISILLPLGVYETTAGRAATLEFGGAGGEDLGPPLMENPQRAPSVISLANKSARAFSIKVPYENGVAFDVRLDRAGFGTVISYGDAPIHVEPGEAKGEITFTFGGGRLAAGNYQLHLLRRFRGLGGEPADWIYPITIVE